MATEFAVCPEDREKYGCPEWVLYDKDQLDDVPFDELDPWDREMIETFGFGINALTAKELLEATVRGITGIVWLSCKLQDVDVPKLAEFNIKTRKVRMRATKRADADPPAQDSSTTSSEETPSKTASSD